MPEEPQVVHEDGISRRRMLKRIGAGAAIAWTAPVITSIRAPVFADIQSPNPCTDQDFVCGGPVTLCGSDANGDCGCESGDRHMAKCVSNTPCDSLVPCNSDADCPSGVCSAADN